MKTTMITLLASMFFITCFAQDELRFEVRGSSSRPVTQETLNKAKYISDFVPGYPVNWITSYASVEISATHQGKTIKAMSVNDELSPAQLDILRSLDLGDQIKIDAKYKYQYGVMNTDVEDKSINISMKVVPEVEAEFAGGKQQLSKFLNENAIGKIPAASAKKVLQAVVKFTVNEEGKVVNAKVSQSSGDLNADKILVEGLSKMPAWKPAQNAKGIKVKQEFELSVGSGGC